MIDRKDALLLARGAFLYALGCVVLLATAGLLGLALRVFAMAGGL
jgi:hypothetical protein